MTTHATRIVEGRSRRDGDYGARVFYVTCECGWYSRLDSSIRAAYAASREHLAEYGDDASSITSPVPHD